jgi:hypothetical protein
MALRRASRNGRRQRARELERLYKEVGAQGSIVIVAGVEKPLVDLNNLNDRSLLLQTRRTAAVYVSRHDYMPIKRRTTSTPRSE